MYTKRQSRAAYESGNRTVRGRNHMPVLRFSLGDLVRYTQLGSWRPHTRIATREHTDAATAVHLPLR